jgi:hypothetical protein
VHVGDEREGGNATRSLPFVMRWQAKSRDVEISNSTQEFAD